MRKKKTNLSKREYNTMQLDIMDAKKKLLRIKRWPQAFLTFAEFNKLMMIRDKMVADGGWTRKGYISGGDAYENARLELNPEMESVMGLFYPLRSDVKRATSYRVDRVDKDGSIWFSNWRITRTMCTIIQKRIQGLSHAKDKAA